MNCTNCGNFLRTDGGPCVACGTLVSSAVESEPVLTAVRIGEVLDGKWRLSRKLGEGGMGIVYLAHDLQLERKVAVKLLAQTLAGDPEIVTRFEREAQLTASLEHPNIVPVYAVGRLNDRPFMVMKALDGLTLAELLRQRGPLTSLETLSLFRQLCAGLSLIHERGYVHRDIKAGNIFVSPDGHATILDFGILRQSGDRKESLTRTGVVMGTPLYMSPEQALGTKEIDHRADLYALAVLLFECVTNTLPFEADNDLKTIQLQAFAPPPNVEERAPWAPPGLQSVLTKGLAKRPDERYQSAVELLDALEDVFGSTVGAPTQRFGSLEASRRPSGPKSPMFVVAAAASEPARKNVPSDTVASGSGEKVSAVRVTSGEPAAGLGAAPIRLEEELPVPGAASRRRMLSWMAAMGTLMVVAGGVAVYASGKHSREEGVRPRTQLAMVPARELLPTDDIPPPRMPVVDAGATSGPVVETEKPVLPNADEPLMPLTVKKGKAAQAKLNVITTHKGDPMWATLFVDGANKGNTPLQLDLPAGKHRLRVVRPGFRTVERQIKIAPGRSDVLRIALTP